MGGGLALYFCVCNAYIAGGKFNGRDGLLNLWRAAKASTEGFTDTRWQSPGFVQWEKQVEYM